MTESQPRLGIADVAKAAGVSRATASLALNDKGRVAPETRERVKQIAAELNYRPNLRAQRLRGGRAHTVALYNPVQSSLPQESQLDFSLDLAMPFAQASLVRGYSLLLIPSLSSHSQVEQFDIDGVVVMDPVEHDPYCAAFRARGAKVVTIGRARHTEVDAAVNRQGAGAMFSHLIAQGATRIGLILAEEPYASRTDVERYVQNLDGGADIAVAYAAVASGEEGGRRAASELLDSPTPPDAIYAPMTAFAVGALAEAAARNIPVPDRLMVSTNYDGRQAGAGPSLTSLDLRFREMATAAADLLFDLLDGADVTDALAPEPTVIPRETTARIR
jgi:DNA-binding LacI/PurR family transcriptional regulator